MTKKTVFPMLKKISRRFFIFVTILSAFFSISYLSSFFSRKKSLSSKTSLTHDTMHNNKMDKKSHVCFVQNSTPEKNTRQVIKMMGGITNFIGIKDIVILKPNAQWINQGMTNTNAMKSFIEMVLAIPGFSGEIIIAENHHLKDDNSMGWTTNSPNGDFNYNELVNFFQKKGYANVTKYHWHDQGKNPNPREGNAYGSKIVKGPEKGDGYCWRKDMVYTSPEGRKCIMTYPIFKSSYSNITVDLLNGAWKHGNYLDIPVKLINFSALNHHSRYAGITASIKNLMGIVDMTCGYQGTYPEGYYNTHFIGSENIIYKYGTRFMFGFSRRKMDFFTQLTKYVVNTFGKFNFWYAGGALGYWMANIKKPDLNIITAEKTGWGGRSNTAKAANTKSVMASTDPVALDYCAVKYILYPATQKAGKEGMRYLKYNHPEYLPFKKFLKECSRHVKGNFDDKNIILDKSILTEEKKINTWINQNEA